MARKVITTTEYYDDFDDKPIQEGMVETIKFGWEGDDYTIDLRPENAVKLRKDVEKWVAAATKEMKAGARGRRRASTGDGRANTGSGRSKEELQAVRDWCAKEGIEVAPRGRIAATVLEKFDEAHKN
ncbi:MAG: Lsr2 family protein [Rhodococcus qingshengii]|uniref:histone-like nucleoid-structuring protein Lsr2 n=1 Tax=Rhodococcus erythropolis TaxID=1833 RepID=UPI00301400C4